MQLSNVKEFIKNEVIKDGQPMRASFEIMEAVYEGFYDGILEVNKSVDVDLSEKDSKRFGFDCIRFGIKEYKSSQS